MRLFFFQLILFFCLESKIVKAKDFGQLNQVFNISEERLIDYIQKRMSKINWQEVEKEWRAEMSKKIENPKQMVFVSKVMNFQRKIVDLSFELPNDIFSSSGEIVVAKGFKIDPAKQMKMKEKLIFLDSCDEKQVSWLKRQKLSKSDLIVLVAGKPLQLEKELSHKVYFDQTGELAKKFKLTASPSVVRQIEEEIVVEEYPFEVDLKV